MAAKDNFKEPAGDKPFEAFNIGGLFGGGGNPQGPDGDGSDDESLKRKPLPKKENKPKRSGTAYYQGSKIPNEELVDGDDKMWTFKFERVDEETGET